MAEDSWGTVGRLACGLNIWAYKRWELLKVLKQRSARVCRVEAGLKGNLEVRRPTRRLLELAT